MKQKKTMKKLLKNYKQIKIFNLENNLILFIKNLNI